MVKNVIVSSLMEELYNLKYSTMFGKSKSRREQQNYWIFYNQHSELTKLLHSYIESIIPVNNDMTGAREYKTVVSDKFYVMRMNIKNDHQVIYDIQDWIKDNIECMRNSSENYLKSSFLITLITHQIGQNTNLNEYEMIWNVPKVVDLTLDLYSCRIFVNYKNKITELSEEKLKIFLENNTKVILEAKEKINNKYILKKRKRQEATEIEELEKQTQKMNLEHDFHDATKKVGNTRNCKSFIIKNSLQRRYEIQTCKPYPQDYEWN